MRLLAGHVSSDDHVRGGEWLVAAHKDPFRPATWTATLDASTPVELVRDLYAAAEECHHRCPCTPSTSSPTCSTCPSTNAEWSATPATPSSRPTPR
ncbi:DUF317 domain-containing protein [Streptomyces cellulosae]|uniref:DUF317 domain-containing protein n=1 Tax=Streptomyces cellulosae TaxID=1968 RepID=UPI00387E4A88